MSIRLQQKNPLTNADAVVTVEGVAGYWTKMSGLAETVSRAMYSDGSTNRKRYATSGSSEIDEVTISRPFDPDNADDQAAYEWAKSVRCGDTFQVQVRPVRRCDGVEQRGSKALFFYGCRLTKLEFMNSMDTGAGDSVVELSVTYSVDDYDFV
jgi:hypothetical protein